MTYFSKVDNLTLIHFILNQSQFTIDKRKSLLEVMKNEGTAFFNSSIANRMPPLQRLLDTYNADYETAAMADLLLEISPKSVNLKVKTA
jgi:hypothetical protein